MKLRIIEIGKDDYMICDELDQQFTLGDFTESRWTKKDRAEAMKENMNHAYYRGYTQAQLDIKKILGIKQ